MALISIGRSKLRSFLTVLGIIIGIGSVVSVIAVGEGVKGSVESEFSGLGINLISITQLPQGEALTEKDVDTVKQNYSIATAVPQMYVTGTPKRTSPDKDYGAAILTATQPGLKDIIKQELAAGRFFNDGETKAIIVGDAVAKGLFDQDNPLDKEITIYQKRTNDEGQTTIFERRFKIVGVYKKLSESTSFGPGAQLDAAIYMPLADGKEFNDNKIQIDEISAQAKSAQDLAAAKDSITEQLKNNHKGKADFTVSTSEDVAKSYKKVLDQTTNFVAAIAAISLLVGGIGIMNVMTSSVTERTREIGIRKAIGARKSVILYQFLMEAMILTLLGGLLGIVAAFGISALVEATQDLKPVFTVRAFVIALGISIAVGVVFGMAPALKAARKKPIEALRYE